MVILIVENYDIFCDNTFTCKDNYIYNAKSRKTGVANMVLQNLGVSQNFSQNSRVSQSCFFSGYVRLAVSLFIRRCLGVSIFSKTKGLEVPDSFVCLF